MGALSMNAGVPDLMKQAMTPLLLSPHPQGTNPASIKSKLENLPVENAHCRSTSIPSLCSMEDPLAQRF